jgi:hypothetical protein
VCPGRTSGQKCSKPAEADVRLHRHAPLNMGQAGRKGEGHERRRKIRSSRCEQYKVGAEIKAPALTELPTQTVKFPQWTVNLSMRSRLRRYPFFAGAPANSRVVYHCSTTLFGSSSSLLAETHGLFDPHHYLPLVKSPSR